MYGIFHHIRSDFYPLKFFVDGGVLTFLWTARFPFPGGNIPIPSQS